MKKTVSRGPIVAAFLSVVAALAFGACAETHVDPGSSGETHFLNACDTACEGELACTCAVCTAACDEDADCTRFGTRARCMTNCTTAERSCDLPCKSAPDCASLGSGFACTGGVCRPHVVIEDASVEVHPDGAPDTHPDASPATPREAGAKTDGGHGPFAMCNVPTSLNCSIADNCAYVTCGGVKYDGRSCPRAVCTADTDCKGTERCVSDGTCSSGVSCSYQNGVCSCADDDVCKLDAAYCNPIATVGPRGDWVSLTFSRDLKCNSLSCQRSWTVFADGALSITQFPISDAGMVGNTGGPHLSDADLRNLKVIVDGPSLRAALHDGLPCESEADSSGAYTASLRLSTMTVSGVDVSGCVPGDDVFNDVYDILNRYAP
jgi:hypothetical protein